MMNRSKRGCLAILIVAVLALPSAVATAYEFTGKTLRVEKSFTVYTCDSQSTPDPGTTWMNASGAFVDHVWVGMAQWNSLSSKDFFQVGDIEERDCDRDPDEYVGNGISEIMFADIDGRGLAVPATMSGDSLAEVDIHIDWGLPYRFEQECDARPTEPPPAISAVIHELGHVVGLHHEESNESIMADPWANSGYCPDRHLNNFGVFPDDMAGVAALYNSAEDEFRDLAALGYEQRPNFDPDDDFGGAVTVPHILTMSDGSISSFPGESITARFSIANRNETGPSHISYRVVLVEELSDWQLYDQHKLNGPDSHSVAGGYVAMEPGFHTFNVSGTIPEEIPAGSYILAVIVDPSDRLSVFNRDGEWGNESTYLATRVFVYNYFNGASWLDDLYIPDSFYVPGLDGL